MGVNISEILTKKEIDIKSLKGKVIAIDASLFLYQFLTTIRQHDGTPLMDSKGNVTSHLTGLFSRTTRLLASGIRPVYVFDGKPPELKREEKERRLALKHEAQKKYEEALSAEDTEAMRKYAGRTSRLTGEMVAESKELLLALGVPIVQAPSEAEAQASYMVRSGHAYAIATQDADSLMFGAPRIIRNLSVAGKRKKTNSLVYESIRPELIDFSENLNHLGIDQDQLIALCMLVGTDYNIGGIKGIGPKNALKLVKKHGPDIDALFEEVRWAEHFDYSWQEVFYLIKKIPLSDEFRLVWKDIDKEKLSEILVRRHDFSEERVESGIKNLIKAESCKEQKGLGDYF